MDSNDVDEPPALVEAGDFGEDEVVPDLLEAEASDEPLVKVPITIVTGMRVMFLDLAVPVLELQGACCKIGIFLEEYYIEKATKEKRQCRRNVFL